jgi:hypothetical protein
MFIPGSVFMIEKSVGKGEPNPDLGTGWRSVVKFTLRPFYIEGKPLRYALKE